MDVASLVHLLYGSVSLVDLKAGPFTELDFCTKQAAMEMFQEAPRVTVHGTGRPYRGARIVICERPLNGCRRGLQCAREGIWVEICFGCGS